MTPPLTSRRSRTTKPTARSDNSHLSIPKTKIDNNIPIQGLMDIALLSANANQLRHAMELCAPYRSLLIVLFSVSIVLQVVASCILLVERITCKKKDFVKARW